jgi:hypothetical protein
MNFIHEICEKYNITNYTINGDGSIDVVGDVWLDNKGLTELPLTFNKVSGNFICSTNELTTLKGSPRWVGGFFSCNHNQLTSLEFGPDYITLDYFCTNNKLVDNYCETEIGISFCTTLKQDGLILNLYKMATNYNEWRKLYKRKLILDEIFNRNM